MICMMFDIDGRILLRYGTETRMSSLRNDHYRSQSLSVALGSNNEDHDPPSLCLRLTGDIPAMDYLAKLRVVQAIPAPAMYLAPSTVLLLSLLVARFHGLLMAGGTIVAGVAVAHYLKPALTPRQEDCLGVGYTTSIIVSLAGEYMSCLLGKGAGGLVDLAVTALFFIVLVLLSKVMTSEPGKVNGPLPHGPYYVLADLFDDKNFAASAAGTQSPSWESRRRCESCFAKRLPRVKHCHACETCVYRYDVRP